MVQGIIGSVRPLSYRRYSGMTLITEKIIFQELVKLIKSAKVPDEGVATFNCGIGGVVDLM